MSSTSNRQNYHQRTAIQHQQPRQANGQTFYESNLVIHGNRNTIHGDSCSVTGNRNMLVGSNHTVTGNSNTVYSNNSTIIGDFNVIFSNNSTINGRFNALFGSNNTVHENSSTIAADRGNCVIAGRNNITPLRRPVHPEFNTVVTTAPSAASRGSFGPRETFVLSPNGGSETSSAGSQDAVHGGNHNNHSSSGTTNVSSTTASATSRTTMRTRSTTRSTTHHRTTGQSSGNHHTSVHRRTNVPNSASSSALERVHGPPQSELNHDAKVNEEGGSASQNPCIICQENVPICAALPCMHVAYCVECSRALCYGEDGTDIKHRGQLQCSLCREDVHVIKRAYFQ